MRRPDPRSVLFMLLAGSAYGLATPLVKSALLRHISLWPLMLWQYPLGLIVFGQAFIREPQSARQVSGRPFLYMALVGIAASGVYVSYYRSLKYLNASIAVVLLFQFAWMVPLLGRILHHEKITGRQWFGILLIGAGTLFAANLSLTGPLSVKGLLFGLAGAVSYALVLYWSGRLDPALSPWVRTWWSSVFGALTLIMLMPQGQSLTSLIHLPVILWGTAAGLLSQLIPLLLTYLSAPRLGAGLTAILASVELPVAVLASALWIHEPVAAKQWLGVLIILLGIFLATLTKKPEPMSDPS